MSPAAKLEVDSEAVKVNDKVESFEVPPSLTLAAVMVIVGAIESITTAADPDLDQASPSPSCSCTYNVCVPSLSGLAGVWFVLVVEVAPEVKSPLLSLYR